MSDKQALRTELVNRGFSPRDATELVDRQVTLQDLLNCGEIPALRKFLIDKGVSTQLTENIVSRKSLRLLKTNFS